MGQSFFIVLFGSYFIHITIHSSSLLFYRSYMPNKISEVVQMWKEKLSTINEKAGQSLADPKDYENLFPGMQETLKAQQYVMAERSHLSPAYKAVSTTPNWERNLVQEMHNAENEGQFTYNEPVTGIPSEALEEPRYFLFCSKSF